MNISKLISIAQRAGELLAAGTGIPAAIAIGREVIDFMDDVKGTAQEQDQVKLQDAADALWTKIKAHEEATFAKLDEAAKR